MITIVLGFAAVILIVGLIVMAMKAGNRSRGNQAGAAAVASQQNSQPSPKARASGGDD